MAYENIIFETEGDVAVIKFNRPKALNAVNIDVVKDIQKALDEVESNPSVRVLILTGEGDKAFVAGADISLMVNFTPLQLREFSVALHELGFRMEGLPIPVIACVNGFALGGGTEIAMACIRGCQIRPARDQPGNHPRFRRDPASSKTGRKGDGKGTLYDWGPHKRPGG